MMKLRSLVFYAWMCFVYFCITVPFLFTLGLLLPLKLRQRWGYYLGYLMMLGLKPTVGIDFVLEGRRPLESEPAIYVCNHQSVMETMLLPYLLAPISPILKHQLFLIPFIGQSLWLTGSITINRGKGIAAMKKLKRQGERQKKRGMSVLIFPEGTRYPPGCIGPFMPGAATMAKATGLPLVPISMNSGSFWQPHTLEKNPGTVRFVIGEPIDPDSGTSRELTARLQAWIAEQHNLMVVERMKKGKKPS